jgi:hypothetical protein
MDRGGEARRGTGPKPVIPRHPSTHDSAPAPTCTSIKGGMTPPPWHRTHRPTNNPCGVVRGLGPPRVFIRIQACGDTRPSVGRLSPPSGHSASPVHSNQPRLPVAATGLRPTIAVRRRGRAFGNTINGRTSRKYLLDSIRPRRTLAKIPLRTLKDELDRPPGASIAHRLARPDPPTPPPDIPSPPRPTVRPPRTLRPPIRPESGAVRTADSVVVFAQGRHRSASVRHRLGAQT